MTCWKRGFTVIELIIVIIIITILLTVAIPSYMDYQKRKNGPSPESQSTVPASRILQALDRLPDPKDCFFGVDDYVPPTEIARFLSTHPEFKLEVASQTIRTGPIFKRKDCDR